MSSLNVRPVRETDIPAIAAIYAHAVLHGHASFEVEPPGEAEMTKRMHAVVDAGFPYLVAEKDGKVTAIWEMRGRKHLRTIDPRSHEGKSILGTHEIDEQGTPAITE